ncbi:MAG: hypothetical protein ACERKZ_05790 [Lachnotalea sp.]
MSKSISIKQENKIFICAKCGKEIVGEYEYIKTKRKTVLYFHKGMRCPGE